MARLTPPDPPLRDGDLVLRVARPTDVAAIREVCSEADTRRWMTWDDELPDDAEALANIVRSEHAWAAGTHAVFRIVDAATDEVVGGVNLALGPHDSAEVSYFLRSSVRGRGWATRAVLLVCGWGFDSLGLARIFLRVHPDNVASVAVAERAGFSYEGLERSSAVFGDGTRFDSRVYSLLPSDR